MNRGEERRLRAIERQLELDAPELAELFGGSVDQSRFRVPQPVISWLIACVLTVAGLVLVDTLILVLAGMVIAVSCLSGPTAATSWRSTRSSGPRPDFWHPTGIDDPGFTDRHPGGG